MSALLVTPAPSPAVADPQPLEPAERLAALFDQGTLHRIMDRGDGSVLSGTGRIGGVSAVAFASDPRVRGGSLSTDGCESIVAAYEAAMAANAPVIGVWHSGGARLDVGAGSLHAVGTVFAAMTRASGRVPQISVVLGPAAGGAAYGPALTDVVIMAAEGRIFVTGPDVVRSVTGEDATMERLGGPETHGKRSGVAHVVTGTQAQAIGHARRLTVLLGSQGRMTVPGTTDAEAAAGARLAAGLPESPRRAYDVRPLVASMLDEPGLELQPTWAPSIITVLGVLGGRTVGVIANNPIRLGGCLDAASAEKAARFVRMCDAFGVPLAVIVDVPGYLPGVSQEWGGVVRRGAKLLHAFAEARVPRVTLITRKAYGGAYIAMNSRALGATRVFAWPTAEVAVMGAVAAIRVLHRRRLAEAPDEDRAELEARLAADHERVCGGLGHAVDLGIVDEIIDPAQTRQALAQAIAAARPARGIHGNIPL